MLSIEEFDILFTMVAYCSKSFSACLSLFCRWFVCSFIIRFITHAPPVNDMANINKVAVSALPLPDFLIPSTT